MLTGQENEFTIMLIDDDEDDRALFTEAVAIVNANIKCVTARDAAEALVLLKNKDATLPDFIFLDLNMPRMNGKEFYREKNRDENLEKIPVIIYSTSKSPEDYLELKQLGATDFIIKPSTFDGICKVISEVIK